MNGDDTTGDEMNGDDFWGGSPDWADEPRRPRREKRSGDVTGAIKGLWASAMTAGAGATREHRIIDASSPRPQDDATAEFDMFDDLDHDVFGDVDGEVHHGAADGEFAYGDTTVDPGGLPTTDVPVIDVVDDAVFASMEPVSVSERHDMRRRSGAIDPLLMRVGAVALATTLLVPLVMSLNSGDDENDTIATATTEVTSDPAAGGADPAPDADVPERVDEGSDPAALDPATLPPAVPVDDAATATTIDEVSAGDDADELVIGSDEAVDSNEASGSDGASGPDAADPSTSAGAAGQASGADVMQDDSDGATDDDDSALDVAATADEGAERENDCAIDYTVVAGDFWLRLADAAGVPLAELLEANGASTATPLYPDTEICLPAGSTTPAPPSATTSPAPTTEATTTTAAPTTTTAPTTAAPTTTAAPAPTPNTDATRAEVEQIIRDVWPDDLEDRALVIASRESSLSPTAKNFCCYGLFQIYWEVHKSWLADIGVTSDQQLYDPETNARAAYTLYQRSGGWGPWSQTDY